MALECPTPAAIETFTKVPENQPKTWKPGQLNEEQLRAYFTKGFVIIPDFFDKEKELKPVRQDISQLVDKLAEKLYDNGKIKDLYKDYDLFKRLTKIEEDFPGANIVLHKHGCLPPSFRTLWSSDRLLNIMEQLLGTRDIIGHPVWNLRTKTPQNEATVVPWHQDVGYLDTDSYDVLQATAWIPLLDATQKNGCMQVMSGGHRTAKVATHQCCYGNTWYVMLEDEEMEKSLNVDVKRDSVTCEIPYGGMLLLNNLIPHRSLNNLSDDVRWSLDLRWQRADRPVGFYGLKNGILMRSSKGPVDIDWDGFDKIDRHSAQQDYVEKFVPEFNIDETTIAGPWMRKWEIVHMNRHTETLSDHGSSWHAKP